MEAVQQRYEDYLEEYHALQRKRRFGDGMLGMGKAPERELCHARFAQDIQGLLEGLRDLDPEEAEALLRYICFAPLEEDASSEAHWMLLAVHSMAGGARLPAGGGAGRGAVPGVLQSLPPADAPARPGGAALRPQGPNGIETTSPRSPVRKRGLLSVYQGSPVRRRSKNSSRTAPHALDRGPW